VQVGSLEALKEVLACPNWACVTEDILARLQVASEEDALASIPAGAVVQVCTSPNALGTLRGKLFLVGQPA